MMHLSTILRRCAFLLALSCCQYAGAAKDSAEDTCLIQGSDSGRACVSIDKGVGTNKTSNCTALGYNPVLLRCSTCHELGRKLREGGIVGDLETECLGCCKEEDALKRIFSSARMIVDAQVQDKDQDVHDFIKRKAPLFSGLEVEYQEGAWPAIELEKEDDPNHVLRADVSGWKSDHLVEFLTTKFKAPEQLQGAWTAEVQTCSG